MESESSIGCSVREGLCHILCQCTAVAVAKWPKEVEGLHAAMHPLPPRPRTHLLKLSHSDILPWCTMLGTS